MAEMIVSDSFTYWPNPEGDFEEEFKEIVANLRSTLGGKINFVIKLEIVPTKEERQSVEEITNTVNEVMKDAQHLRKNMMIPVGADCRGKEIFQKFEDIQVKDVG